MKLQSNTNHRSVYVLVFQAARASQRSKHFSKLVRVQKCCQKAWTWSSRQCKSCSNHLWRAVLLMCSGIEQICLLIHQEVSPLSRGVLQITPFENWLKNKIIINSYFDSIGWISENIDPNTFKYLHVFRWILGWQLAKPSVFFLDRCAWEVLKSCWNGVKWPYNQIWLKRLEKNGFHPQTELWFISSSAQNTSCRHVRAPALCNGNLRLCE